MESKRIFFRGSLHFLTGVQEESLGGSPGAGTNLKFMADGRLYVEFTKLSYRYTGWWFQILALAQGASQFL